MWQRKSLYADGKDAAREVVRSDVLGRKEIFATRMSVVTVSALEIIKPEGTRI